MSHSAEQLALPLFGHRSFEEIIASRNGHQLEVVVSPRVRRGWYVKISRSSGARTLTVPRYLKDAPDDIKNALIDWALLPDPRRRDRKRVVRLQQLELEHRVWQHVEGLGIPRDSRRIDPHKMEQCTRGCIYDLREVFDSINRFCFDGRVEAALRWGSPRSVTSYQSTRRDPDGNPVHLITIAGVYNHPDVPRYALEGVMHHEMLHIKIPMRTINGRNVIHGADFRRAERSYGCYAAWHLWERECLPQIARRIRQKVRGRT